MNDTQGYAVFFFPQALEALGEAIKPYLYDGPGGQHLLCNEVDAGGALTEMTIQATTTEGRAVSLEVMVPTSMVRMIVSARSDTTNFGFGPRVAPALMNLPPLAATAPPAAEPAKAVPQSGDTAEPTQTPPEP